MSTKDKLVAAARAGGFDPGLAAIVADYKKATGDFQHLVTTGELGAVAARREAVAKAAEAKAAAAERVGSYEPGNKGLRAAIKGVVNTPRPSGLTSAETLAKETRDLMKALLVEQQITNRRAELEAKGYASMAGGAPIPDPLRLLSLAESTDDAAREWARRELAGVLPHVADDTTRRRVQAAVRAPGELDPAEVRQAAAAVLQRPPADWKRALEDAITRQDSLGVAALSLAALRIDDANVASAVAYDLGRVPGELLRQVIDIDQADVEAARDAVRVHAEAVASQIDDLAGLGGLGDAEMARSADAQRRADQDRAAFSGEMTTTRPIDRAAAAAAGRV